jgi:hypothetical protein
MRRQHLTLRHRIAEFWAWLKVRRHHKAPGVPISPAGLFIAK